jgi:hypothetical protein
VRSAGVCGAPVGLVDPVCLDDTTRSNVELGHRTHYELIRADKQGVKCSNVRIWIQGAPLRPSLRTPGWGGLIAGANIRAQPLSRGLLSGRAGGSFCPMCSPKCYYVATRGFSRMSATPWPEPMQIPTAP